MYLMYWLIAIVLLNEFFCFLFIEIVNALTRLFCVASILVEDHHNTDFGDELAETLVTWRPLPNLACKYNFMKNRFLKLYEQQLRRHLNYGHC